MQRTTAGELTIQSDPSSRGGGSFATLAAAFAGTGGDDEQSMHPGGDPSPLPNLVDVGGGNGNTAVLRSEGVTPDRGRRSPWSTPALA